MMLLDGGLQLGELGLLLLLLLPQPVLFGRCLGDDLSDLFKLFLGVAQLGPGDLQVTLSLLELGLGRSELLVLSTGGP
jgi:hypothetical protein